MTIIIMYQLYSEWNPRNLWNMIMILTIEIPLSGFFLILTRQHNVCFWPGQDLTVVVYLLYLGLAAQQVENHCLDIATGGDLHSQKRSLTLIFFVQMDIKLFLRSRKHGSHKAHFYHDLSDG